jgi:hypothetical protein
MFISHLSVPVQIQLNITTTVPQNPLVAPIPNHLAPTQTQRQTQTLTQIRGLAQIVPRPQAPVLGLVHAQRTLRILGTAVDEFLVVEMSHPREI